jgi:hypothetical protein
VCGVCTSQCDVTSDCEALGSGATCDVSTTASLCGSIARKRACLLGCEKDGDCAALGSRAWCSRGSCRSERPGADAGPLSCLDRLNAANGQFEAFVVAADKPANKVCSVDSDCQFITLPPCELQCQGGPAFSAKAIAALAPDLATLDSEVCGPYFTAGCETGVTSCPFLGTPQCRNGLCANSQDPDAGANAGTDAGQAATCDSLTRRMAAFLQQAQEQADKSCTTDQDCTTVTLDQTCYHGCFSVPVSKGGASTVQSALGSTEIDSLCSNFTLAGCKSDVPSCAPLLTPPKCASNACVGPQ